MSSLHRQQLFHWISAGQDSVLRQKGKPIRGRLDSRTRTEYVEHLVGSLRHGLWMRAQFSGEVHATAREDLDLSIGMTCFTEWALDESTDHTERYGRLGFGFPKRWVIARGGQPVTYFRDVKNGIFAKAIHELWGAATDHESRRRNQILLGFAKPLRKVQPPRPAVREPAAKGSVTKRVRVANAFARNWSNTMPFLEEREWRIIEPVVREIRPKVPFTEGKENRPKLYLPYEPGKDLFTIVLPDNETVALALQQPEVQKAVAAKGRPHVTLLSLDDVGTM